MVRETLKMSAIGCSASLVPGISRRSTIAAVIASAMRRVMVAPGSALSPSAGGLASACRALGIRELARLMNDS